MQACVSKFKANGCEQFQFDEKQTRYLVSCSPEELEFSTSDDFFSMAESCGTGVKESLIKLGEELVALPGKVYDVGKRGIKGEFAEAQRQKYAEQLKLCESQFGTTIGALQREFQTSPNQNAARKKLEEFNSCASGFDPNKKGYENVQRTGRAIVTEFKKFSGCYKKQYQAQVMCPAIGSFLAGGAVAKGATAGVASLVRLSAVSKLKKLDELFDILRKEGLVTKEFKTIDHLEDLVSSLENPRVRQILKDSGIDVDQYLKGVVGSDFGKFSQIWKTRVLEKGPDSESLLSALKGEGNAPSAQAMREIFKDNDMKPFLNPKMDNDALRSAFQGQGGLQGYLHEIPGMVDAIKDLENGFDKLTSSEKAVRMQQFKTRISTNLFHNGPNAGFWKIFGEGMLPGQLDSNPNAAKIFSGTAFDSGRTTKGGSVIPAYPSPISKEGVLHTLFDRMSQATRGGMDKIYNEMNPILDAKKAPKTKLKDLTGFDGKLVDKFGQPIGLGGLKEMVLGNPQKTMEQLAELRKHLAILEKNKKITSAEKLQLQSLIQDGEERLKKQLAFANKNVKIHPSNGPIEKIEFTDANGKVVRVDGETPSDEALAKLQDFMKGEEKINGDPIKGLGVKPGSAPTKLAVASTLANCAANRPSQRALNQPTSSRTAGSSSTSSEAGVGN